MKFTIFSDASSGMNAWSLTNNAGGLIASSVTPYDTIVEAQQAIKDFRLWVNQAPVKIVNFAFGGPITPRNGSSKERLLEIASRIHCPDSEGGNYAHQIKEEIEQVAHTLGDSSYGVTLEAAQFGQRVEPKFGTIVYKFGDIWVEQMPKAKDKVGVYVGNFLVAINET